MINYSILSNALAEFKQGSPFHHCIIDNFFSNEIAHQLSAEFLPYEDERWFFYNNPVEHKKALNDWNIFPPVTYQVFSLLNSREFVSVIEKTIGTTLFVDHGLHGGGWHIHASGGNLNPHLDYSIHPKMKLQRKLNIIVYLSEALLEKHGGHLGLWHHDPVANQPGELAKEIQPKFNRAVLFDTTQNSWHGLSRILRQPRNIYRKSLAVYYLCSPTLNADERERALFAPREEQKSDREVHRLISLRSSVTHSKNVYRT